MEILDPTYPLVSVANPTKSLREPFIAIAQEPHPRDKQGNLLSPFEVCEVLIIAHIPYEHNDAAQDWVAWQTGKDWHQCFSFDDGLWKAPIHRFAHSEANDQDIRTAMNEVIAWKNFMAEINSPPSKILWGIHDTVFGREFPEVFDWVKMLLEVKS